MRKKNKEKICRKMNWKQKKEKKIYTKLDMWLFTLNQFL